MHGIQAELFIALLAPTLRIGTVMYQFRSMQLSFVAGILIAGALVSVPVAAAATVPSPVPAQVSVTPAADQSVTVATIDPVSGKVTASWTGPQSQRDQEVAAQRSAIGSPLPPTQPGRVMPLISRHSPCTAGTGYFEIYNSPPLVCFANSGATSVTLYSVYEFYTGNNVGGVHWLCGGGTCDSGYWPKWSTVLFGSPLPTVTYVYIQ
jgi:hypothetical protein